MARRGKGWAAIASMAVAIVPVALVTMRADAFPEGAPFANCVTCHTPPPSVSATTNVVIAAPATVNAGGIYAVYVYVTNAMYQKFGFSLHASAGSWYVADPSTLPTTTIIGGDATHDCLTRGCGSDGCTGSYYAYWVAPSTSASTVTFSAYGLAHDGNATGCPGSPSGIGSTGDVTGIAIERTSSIFCGSGFHRCGVDCVRDDDPSACGTTCTACIAPTGGTARCEGVGPAATCVGHCPLDAHLCGGACVPDSPTACGSACDTCEAPVNATATCIVGACSWDCDPGYVACGDACITGTCEGFDGGVDARDAGRDAAIDTELPEEDTFVDDTGRSDVGAENEPSDDSSGCGCDVPGRTPSDGAGAIAIVAALVTWRRRYKRMSM